MGNIRGWAHENCKNDGKATEKSGCSAKNELSDARCREGCNLFPAETLNRQKGGSGVEPRTLEELYRRYAGELYLYAYSLCQNEAQAQDLTAEAFCRALLALDGADAGWRSWLYKVCRNLWLDQVRRSRRLAPEPPGPELAAEGDVLEELLQEERRRAVYRAVQALSPVDREIVTLHYYGGLSLKEAGEAMGLTPGAARTLLCRARKKLKSRLEGQI